MRELTTIMSGGQTGVDQAALRAAKACGLAIGGWCSPGRASESGVIPPEFPLQETEQECSPEAPDVPRSQRTEWNVRDSDATLVILSGKASRSDAATEQPRDRGTEWTIECAAIYGRPLLVCNVEDPNAEEKIRKWLGELPISILNVAGPSESTSPGIGDRAYDLLHRVFEDL